MRKRERDRDRPRLGRRLVRFLGRTGGLALAASAATLPAASLASTQTPPTLSPAARSALAEPPAAPAPPANDEIANAQSIQSLPTTLNGTTVGASTVSSESTSACGGPTVNSVWYVVHTSSTGPQRIGIELAAAGKLDAAVDVYRAVRSQLTPVACEQTEEEGRSSLTFQGKKSSVYEIRVAALQNSQLAGFTLSVFLPTPSVKPPGLPLRAGGASGQVDRIQDVNAAYSLALHAGVSYMISLTDRTRHGACPSAALFAPGTTSFEGGSALLRIECGGYRLFTPGPGQGGRYVFEITPRTRHTGVQRFHLEVAPAGPDETAPGIALGNYGVAHASLNGGGVQVLRLYRLDVTSHSNLTLRLRAPEVAEFNLRLLNQEGAQVACQCGGSGSQKLQQRLTAGRYYVAVSVRNGTSGSFTLERESRTITHTKAYFGRIGAPAGRETPIHVRVSPGASGSLTVNIERFDPVFGWQFYRQVRTHVSGGAATVPFTAPAVGRWRADARYAGSRVSSPSAVGFTYLTST